MIELVDRPLSARWAPRLLALLCGVLAIASPLWRGGEWLADDLLSQFLPNFDLMWGAFPVLGAPATNPFGGLRTPYWADPQTLVLYPPAWLLVGLRPERGVLLLTFFHVAVSALGVVRWLGRSRISLGVSLVIAPQWALSTWLLAHAVHPTFTASAAWLPWIAASTTTLLRGAAPWSEAPRLAGFLALALLAGSPDMLLLSLCCATVVAGFVLASEKPRASALVPLVVAGVVALALAAAQLLPTILYAPHSVRDLLVQAEVQRVPLLPASLLRLLNPFFWGHPYHAGELAWANREQESFIGLLPVLLLPLAFSPRRHPLLKAGWVLLIAGLAVAMLRLPTGGLFRVTSRFTVLAVWGGLCLSAVVVDELVRTPLTPTRRGGLIAWGIALLAVLALVRGVEHGNPVAAGYAHVGALMSALMLAVLLTGLLQLGRWPRGGLVLLGLAGLGHLAWLGWDLIPVAQSGSFALTRAPATQLQAIRGRILDVLPESQLLNHGAVWRAPMVRAYGPLLAREAWAAVAVRNGDRPDNVALHAATLRVRDPADPSWQELGVGGWLQPADWPAPSAGTLAWRDPFLAVYRPPWPVASAWYAGGSVMRRTPALDVVELRVDGPGGMLISDEVLTFGLQVRVDDEPAPWRLDRQRVAVEVPAGAHDVTLRWRVVGLVPGAAGSALGILLWLALWLRARRIQS